MRRQRPGRATLRRRPSAQEAQADEPDDDQINRDDDVQEPRNDEDENAGDERDDGLEMIDAEGHGISPDIMRAKETPRVRSGSAGIMTKREADCHSVRCNGRPSFEARRFAPSTSG